MLNKLKYKPNSKINHKFLFDGNNHKAHKIQLNSNKIGKKNN